MLFDIGVGNYSWQYVPIGHLESNSKAVDNFHIFISYYGTYLKFVD